MSLLTSIPISSSSSTPPPLPLPSSSSSKALSPSSTEGTRKRTHPCASYNTTDNTNNDNTNTNTNTNTNDGQDGNGNGITIHSTYSKKRQAPSLSSSVSLLLLSCLLFFSAIGSCSGSSSSNNLNHNHNRLNRNNDNGTKNNKPSFFSRIRSPPESTLSSSSLTLPSSNEPILSSTSIETQNGMEINTNSTLTSTAASPLTIIESPTSNMSTTTTTTTTSSILSSILLSIQNNISTKQILQFSLSGIQLSICYYIFKALYKAILEVIDEYEQQYQAMENGNGSSFSGGSGSNGRGGNGRNGNHGVGNGGGWKVEDHDLPFLNEDSIDHVLNEMIMNQYHDHHHDPNHQDTETSDFYNNKKDLGHGHDIDHDHGPSNNNGVGGEGEGEGEGGQSQGRANGNGNDSNRNDSSSSSSTQQPSSSSSNAKKNKTAKRQPQPQPKPSFSSTTSNLALRLQSAGLPITTTTSSSSSIPSTSSSSSSHHPKNVQSILKSLTRTEGYLLSNSLLSPIDLQLDNGSVGIKGMAADDSTSTNQSQHQNQKIVDMWNDIGGLEDVKEGLLDIAFPMMAMFQQQQQQQSQSNNEDGDDDDDYNANNYHDPTYYGGLLSNPPGLLLYGPPGCGKTMLVRALAHTVNARFLCITPSTLLRKYVGETNLNVRALFTLAQKISPCIIFIDEMEGLFRERSSGKGGNGGGGGGGDEHEVNRELKTEFLQLMDGIQGSASSQNVIIIGATNRPFDIDSAFLRRMPRSFFVGLPDFSSRVSILNKMLMNVPLEERFDLEHVAKATEGYTPSDIKEVLRTAALTPLREARMKAMEDHMRAIQEGKPPPPLGKIPRLRSLTSYDILQAQSRVSPTQLSSNYRAALLEYAYKATGGRVGGVTMGGGNDPSQWNPNPSTPAYSPPNDEDGYYFANIDSKGEGSFYNDNNNAQGGEVDYDDETTSSYDDE